MDYNHFVPDFGHFFTSECTLAESIPDIDRFPASLPEASGLVKLTIPDSLINIDELS